ncbi:alkaline phosphatase [Ancylomarina salipaludis]|uniref:Alkaline phosphatase n=1 Tax=Ancylomarina salipaludis TaxID=2501299 RepID=A0A4Q1JNI1_9BACT|nr:alkaline phosphatase [Ancylomarina salipaludis]RXQ96264.1 alkaline phosphatase [Ancylomarina salipaludis]
MKFNSKIINLFFALLLLSISVSAKDSAADKQRNNYKGKAPKYIFYFIGDGMGLSQANAAEAYMAAVNGQDGIQKLEMNKFPHHGFYTTNATNRFITGSAAAGTALATGHKTSINTIGMDASKQKPLQSVAEKARDLGYKVGIVSSVSIDHATPASFYAHQPSRSMYYDISLELSQSNFNYFAGGGINHPVGDGKEEKNNILANFGMGGDKQIENKQPNSIDLAKERGYRVLNTKAEFNNLKKGDDKIIAIAPRLVGGKALPYAIDQNENDIPLSEFTKKGIELLNNNKGFFMMVEGGKIDWTCHANDAATAIKEVMNFDAAIKVAVDFYNKHPKETLIVVGGDHETGGMSLGFSGSHYHSAFKLLQYQNISNDGFTELVNEYKKNNMGNYKLEDGMALIEKHFGLGNKTKELELSALEKKQLKNAFEQSMKDNKEIKKDDQFYLLYGSYNPLAVTACHILSQKAGIGWTSFSHTATPIPVKAIGVGSELFSGYFDNTDMAKNIFRLLELN